MAPIIASAARALCAHDAQCGKAGDGNEAWREYVSKARDVLIAIRDATDEMARAGRAAAHDRVVDLGESDAKAIFAAMLDAALWDE